MTEKEKIDIKAEALELLGVLLAYTSGYWIFIDDESKELKVMHKDSCSPLDAVGKKFMSATSFHNRLTKKEEFKFYVYTFDYTADEMDTEIKDELEFPTVEKALEYMLYIKTE